VSISVVVTLIVFENELYFVSVDEEATVIDEFTLPSSILSVCPVIVIVCGVFQLDVVNVNELGDEAASVASLSVVATITLADGLVSSTYVNEEVPPPSATVWDDVLTVTPAVCMSTIEAVTDISLRAS
jgi:hypothetical protein